MPLMEAKKISVSEVEKNYLGKIANSRTESAGLVRRAKIILNAHNKKGNNEIARLLDTSNKTVKLWRGRWAKSHAERMKIMNTENYEKILEIKINEILSDCERPGHPARITPEQKAQILSLACENPKDIGLPFSHWTIGELLKEVKRRKIVEQISWTRVQNFLKYR